MKNGIKCIGCKNYYLYYSRKESNYIITENTLEAFDNAPWVPLEDKNISDLIKLLKKHEILIESNKANLSERRKSKKPVERSGNYVPLSGPDDDIMVRVEDNYDNL